MVLYCYLPRHFNFIFIAWEIIFHNPTFQNGKINGKKPDLFFAICHHSKTVVHINARGIEINFLNLPLVSNTEDTNIRMCV